MEEHANLLTECVEAFNASPTAKLRARIFAGAAGGWAALVLLAVLARLPGLAVGLLGLGLMTGLAYFAVNGLTRQSALFNKASEFLIGGTRGDWALLVSVLLLLLTLLYVFQMLWGWVFFGLVGLGAAVATHWKLDRELDAERREPLEKARALLRRLRLQGVDEVAIRQFVCKFSGPRWEAFFEALFGYEAKRDARRTWGRSDRGLSRITSGDWCDPIIGWIETKERPRRAARETKLLQRIEEKSLESQGVNLLTARRKARRIAEAMVAVAQERNRPSRHFTEADEGPSIPIGRALRDAGLKTEAVLQEHEPGLIGPRSWKPLALIVGPRVRFLAGAVLMAGFLAWVHQNQIVTAEQLASLKEAAAKAVESRDVQALRDAKIDLNLDKPTQALKVDLPEIPREASRVLGLFNGFNPGVAGLILLISSFFGGVRVGIGAFAGALIAWLGPEFGLPGAGSLHPSMISMIGGSVVAILAILLGRER